MVKPAGSHQDNQLVKIRLSVEIRGIVSCHKRKSVRLAMCLYLAVVTWEDPRHWHQVAINKCRPPCKPQLLVNETMVLI